MGWFSKKVPASEGLAAVAVSSALAALDAISDRRDALRIAAFMVAYVVEKQSAFDVPKGALDQVIEYSMANLAQRGWITPDVSMSYLVNTAMAMRLIKESTENLPDVGYFELVGPWANERAEVLNYIRMSKEAADTLVIRHSRDWKFGS